MSSKRSKVHPKYKTKYRVRNWPAYDRSLVARGDLTVRITPDTLDAWHPAPTGRRGAQPKFSDLAIETALALRLMFNLSLRKAEGFLGWILRIMDLDLESPDHTTLSRRGQSLPLDLRASPTQAPSSADRQQRLVCVRRARVGRPQPNTVPRVAEVGASCISPSIHTASSWPSA